MRRLAHHAIKIDNEDQAYIRGLAYYKNEKYEKALSEFTKANSHLSHYMSVITHMRLGNLDEAHKSLWKYENAVSSWNHNETNKRIRKIRSYLTSIQ
jgi:tetratricopeptide (TPR) repeat protein